MALEKDKAECCYALWRALNAKRVVECGTSYGVSTLYLAAAIRDNVLADGGQGVVIGTEHEPAKAQVARRNFAAAGLEHYIDLCEGDLAHTLAYIEGPLDFVLFAIWTEAVMPAIRNIAPRLRRGAILVADNSVQSRRGYEAYFGYFAYIADPANGLRTLTLPFVGGLEMTVKA